MSKNTEMVLRSAEGLFGSSELLTIKPEKLAPEDALIVWSLFDVMEKELVKKRKDEFRTYLMDLAKEYGKENDKGSFVYNPPHSDGKITAQRRKGKVSLFQDEAEDLLVAKSLDGEVMSGSLRASKGVFNRLLAVVEGYTGPMPTEDLAVLIKTIQYSVDEKKLEGAFAMGYVTGDEIKSVSGEGDATFALTVKKPSVVTDMVKRGK